MSYKIEVITQAIEARKREVDDYQINIDNFKIAIEQNQDDVETAQFIEHLKVMLADNLREQKKAVVILRALETQLFNLQNPPVEPIDQDVEQQ